MTNVVEWAFPRSVYAISSVEAATQDATNPYIQEYVNHQRVIAELLTDLSRDTEADPTVFQLQQKILEAKQRITIAAAHLKQGSEVNVVDTGLKLYAVRLLESTVPTFMARVGASSELMVLTTGADWSPNTDQTDFLNILTIQPEDERIVGLSTDSRLTLEECWSLTTFNAALWFATIHAVQPQYMGSNRKNKGPFSEVAGHVFSVDQMILIENIVHSYNPYVHALVDKPQYDNVHNLVVRLQPSQ